MNIGTEVKSALQDSKYNAKTKKWDYFDLYPGLRGEVLETRSGATLVGWHMEQKTIRLVQTDNVEQPIAASRRTSRTC